MKTLEIHEIPPLSPGELSSLDAHSVINVLNVLRCELMLVGEAIAQNSDFLQQGIALSADLLAGTHDREKTLRQAGNIEEIARKIFEELETCLSSTAIAREKVQPSVDNINTVLMVLTLRAREVLARAAAPDHWEDIPVVQIESDLRELFITIQKTSRRHFSIVLNAALKTDADYYVDLRIEAPNGIARVPSVFPEVIRDLSANARKYTAPGGRLIVALCQDSRGTHLTVEDTGCGIPPDELELVVHCGKRASNASSKRTMGGGFGLTKAFLTAKQFGGRFWIGSELGLGTIVRIWLPPYAGPDLQPQTPAIQPRTNRRRQRPHGAAPGHS